MNNDYRKLAARSRWLVLLSYFGLLLVFSLSTLLWPGCGRSPNWIIWLLQVLPLLMFCGGVLRQHVRSHVWLGFISLGYFTVSVTGLFGCQTLLSALEVLLVVTLFVAAMLYIRWQSRALKSAPE